MSKYVLLSDLHGNYPALQKVVEAEGRDKEYIVLGDIHGLNAYPAETIDELQLLNKKVTLAGNHDKAIIGYGEGHVNSDELSQFELYHTLSNLSVEQVKWMLKLSYMEVIEGSPRILATHAMPWPEKASGYEMGNAGITKGNVLHFASIVADDYDYVLHGHTHEQYDLNCSKFGHDVHFVNPGSLGYQQEYAVVDTATGDVKLKEVKSTDEEVVAHLKEVLPDDAPSVERWY